MWHPAIPATTLSERPRNFGAVLRFGNQSATQNAADGCRIGERTVGDGRCAADDGERTPQGVAAIAA